MRTNARPNTKCVTLLLLSITWTSLLLLSSSYLYSQNSNEYIFDIQEINVEDGLPNKLVYQVGQDSKGFIWVSSYGYLSRYDGYSFKNYPCELFMLTNSYGINFHMDANDNLWVTQVGTPQKSLSIFLPDSEQVINLSEYIPDAPFQSSDIISLSTQRLKEGMQLIWLVLKNGEVYSYDGTDLKLHFTVNEPQDQYSLHDSPIYFDGKIYYTTHNSLLQYTTEGELQNKWTIDNARSVKGQVLDDQYILTSISEDGCGDIYKLENNKIVIILTRIGYCTYDYNYNSDNSNLLWVNDKRSIMSFDKDLKLVFKQSFPSKFRKDKLRELDKIFIDKKETIWCATNEGIIKISRKSNLFTNYLSGRSIRGIYKVRDSLIVANYSKDQIINLEEKTIEKGILNSNLVTGLTSSNNKNFLYACTSRELKVIDTQTWKVFNYPRTNDELFYCIEYQKTGDLFIASPKGFQTLNTITDTIAPIATTNSVLNNCVIRYLFQNNEGVWAATDKGIFLVNENWEVLQHISSKTGLPTDHFNYIYEDKNGIFWLGSRGQGLVKWDRKSKTFKQYGKDQGLLNENIYAIFEDDYGYLWLPSDYGLMRFNKQTEITNTFLTRDGLPSVEFNSYAYHQATDGTLFLGGINGLVQFHPRDFLVDTTSVTPLHITSFKVLQGNDKEFTDLTNEVLTDNKIIVSPSDKLFEIRFALMDFINSNENNYAYKIEGYNKDWQYIDENFIRITGLPYGKYLLKIKGQGDKGQWSGHVLELDLLVKKPFYLQHWFILLVLLLMVAAILGWLQYRNIQHQKERIQLETEVTKRTAIIQQQTEDLKMLDKAKSRFFSNVTHEFRTPLTLLIGPIEQMLKRNKDPWFQSQLEMAQRNGHQLLGLINQLLDISKLEAGQMKVTPTYGDLVAFLKEKAELFQPLAAQKKIELIVVTSHLHWETSFDKIKLTKIVNNLLSNALKFTPNGGKVFLNLDCYKQHFQVQVEDTGVGISQKKLPYIYDRFYQADSSTTREGEGTGIGLALVKELIDLQEGKIEVVSEKGKGTTFIVNLPTFQDQTEVSPQETSSGFIPTSLVNEMIELIPNKAPSEKLIVLIIEDNSDMRAYIRSCLNEEIYQIIEAPNGKIGLEQALKIVPDLIISDVMMPLMDGFEVSEHIRSDLRTSHIPIILLTAKTAIDSRLKGFESGIDAYMTKPFNINELTLRIDKLIELRLHLQDKYQTNNNQSDLKNIATEQENQFISNLKTIILDNLANPDINGEYLGKQIGLSRMQLYRKLKALTNKTITQFIKEIRLDESVLLLKKQEMNISEVAYQVGFNTPTQFSKAFKKRYGQTPSQIKKT